MSVTVYADSTLFASRLPATAWGSRTVADVDTALAEASGMMDDCFRGRWILPFASVGISVQLRCVDIARYLFLGGRGFSPVTESDKTVVADYEAAMAWLDRVQRRVAFPDVTLVSTTSDLDQPFVISSSVVDITTGRTASNRGW